MVPHCVDPVTAHAPMLNLSTMYSGLQMGASVEQAEGGARGRHEVSRASLHRTSLAYAHYSCPLDRAGAGVTDSGAYGPIGRRQLTRVNWHSQHIGQKASHVSRALISHRRSCRFSTQWGSSSRTHWRSTSRLGCTRCTLHPAIIQPWARFQLMIDWNSSNW